MPTDDLVTIYRGIRGRVSDLVRDLDADTLGRTCPATPEWTVRDVVAHLAGAVTDIVEGNLEGVASDPWTQAQVDRSVGAPIDDLLAEWDRGAAQVEPTIDAFPPRMQMMFLTDAVTHEHDVRHAIGRPGARDSDAVAYAYGRALISISRARDEAEVGAVRIVHDAGEDVAGTGEPTATLRTSRFEIVRAVVGRRSYSEIEAWDWDGEPTPTAFVYGMFSPPRSTPLDEG